MAKKEFRSVSEKGSSDLSGELIIHNPSILAKEGVTDKMLLQGVFKKYTEEERQGPRGKFTSKAYQFEDEDGNLVIVNACGHLNSLMKDVSPGTHCQVFYKEFYKGPEGEFHRMDVRVAD